MLDIRASLGLSSNWGGQGLFGGLPRCKEADLMTADEAMADRAVLRSAVEEGEAHPNQCVGPTGAVPAALTMAIPNKSGKKLKEC